MVGLFDDLKPNTLRMVFIEHIELQWSSKAS